MKVLGDCNDLFFCSSLSCAETEVAVNAGFILRDVLLAVSRKY